MDEWVCGGEIADCLHAERRFGHPVDRADDIEGPSAAGHIVEVARIDHVAGLGRRAAVGLEDDVGRQPARRAQPVEVRGEQERDGAALTVAGDDVVAIAAAVARVDARQHVGGDVEHSAKPPGMDGGCAVWAQVVGRVGAHVSHARRADHARVEVREPAEFGRDAAANAERHHRIGGYPEFPAIVEADVGRRIDLGEVLRPVDQIDAVELGVGKVGRHLEALQIFVAVEAGRQPALHVLGRGCRERG